MHLKQNNKLYGRPVIIIAAARSGTKMLREVLAQSITFVEFQYDMNYIWLYGNYNKNHDELLGVDATPIIKKFIKNHFKKLLRKSVADRVLEKSVPNSLRVEFVREVFPDAQFIHLYRNGMDVTADAMQCWNASMFSQRIQKKSDLLKKIITFPYISSFPYLKDYVANYLKSVITQKHVVKSWGPRYKGITKDLETLSLVEVCGVQWARSVRRSIEQLASLPDKFCYINVKYENLVQNPKVEIDRICDFLNIDDTEAVIQYAKENIRPDFVDCYKQLLDEEDKINLMPLIEKELQELGYSKNEY